MNCHNCSFEGLRSEFKYLGQSGLAGPMETRQCPVCRTVVTCNGVEEDEKSIKDLMDDLKSAYEANEYSKAKKLIKEISRLNRQLDLPGLDEYIKSIRREIFQLSES